MAQEQNSCQAGSMEQLLFSLPMLVSRQGEV